MLTAEPLIQDDLYDVGYGSGCAGEDWPTCVNSLRREYRMPLADWMRTRLLVGWQTGVKHRAEEDRERANERIVIDPEELSQIPY